MGKMRWKMKCLLCPPSGNNLWWDLVSIQGHVMDVHGYSRWDLQNNTRRPFGAETPCRHWVYTMPDGKDWMIATKEA